MLAELAPDLFQVALERAIFLALLEQRPGRNGFVGAQLSDLLVGQLLTFAVVCARALLPLAVFSGMLLGALIRAPLRRFPILTRRGRGVGRVAACKHRLLGRIEQFRILTEGSHVLRLELIHRRSIGSFLLHSHPPHLLSLPRGFIRARPWYRAFSPAHS